jgi:hypothetical protein
MSPNKTNGECTKVTLPVRVSIIDVSRNIEINGWALDLCEHGIKIDAPSDFSEGAPVAISALAREGSDVHRIKLTGTVAFTDDSGTGVRFDAVSEDEQATLTRLIAYFPKAA